MSFDIILPGGWELIKNVEYELFSLSVPTKWQQSAKSLAKQRCENGYSKYPSVPVSSFDPIITASFPQLIKTERGGWQKAGVPWLFATEKINLLHLPELVKDWLREEFSWCLGEEQVNSQLDKLNHDDWEWNNESIIKPVWNLPNSNYHIDFRFQTFPDYLALEFLKNSQSVCFGNNNQYQLQFCRVVKLGKGVELMSWPPYPVPLIKNKKQLGTAQISFVINFKLQTVPWRKEPMIYHQLSIRRWLTDSKPLPYGGATAYIGAHRRWLDGERQPFCMIPLQIKRLGMTAQWSKAIRELLKINDSPLPDPEVLASEPVYNWSEINEDIREIQAAIAYDTRHRGEAPCLPGVSPRDLASLDCAILERLPIIQRVGVADRVGKHLRPFWKLSGTPNTPILHSEITTPATFRNPVNSPKTILILWETTECRDAVIAAICKLLSLSPTGEEKIYEINSGVQVEETYYKNDLASICIKTQHVQDLTQRLNIDPKTKVKDRQQQRVQLMDERINQIKSSLPPAEGLSGAIIEIKPKKSFFPAESDPKLALRIGVMKAGYVNQHLYGLKKRKKGEPNRIQNAVTDLLRQFGVLPTQLIDAKKDGIKPDVWLTCFYVLRRTKKTTANNKPSTVALMLRVNPVTGIVQVTTPSLFPEWVFYPVALQELLNEKWEPDSFISQMDADHNDEEKSSDRQREQQFLNGFLTKCLRDCLSTPIEQEEKPHVLLMVEAQNSRKMLTWLQNPNVPINNLPSEIKREMTESEINRLWLVRMRVAENGEVPVAIVKDSPGSRSNIGGLFLWQNVCDDPNNSIYLSLRKMLNTEQNILAKSQSRFDNGSSPAGNPRPIEMIIIHHPGIERDKLASFVHNLRRRWPYFADDVSLPFPFPFATLAKEYAVSVKDTVESEDVEETSE